MTILEINKYYYLKGGAERYLLELAELLHRHRHEVVPFAMADEKNFPTPWAPYFVSPVQTEKVLWAWSALKTTRRVIYSHEAKNKLESLIATAFPQVAHVHNIYHQLSSSVLDALREKKVPTVMTVHDFRLLSPNYSLFHDGKICERAVRDPWRAVGHRCVKNSLAASALAAFETWAVRQRRVYERSVARFIVPSQFVMAIFERFDWDTSRFVYLPHFLNAKTYQPDFKPGESVVYVGRLSAEKGLDVILSAAKKLTDVRFEIIGTGPEEKRLKSLKLQWGLKNVEFLGFLEGDLLHQAVRRAALVVAPSLSYETFGFAILEAMALGKPVAASLIGAYPELITSGQEGVLVPPGEHEAWAEVIGGLLGDRVRLEAMGRAGRELVTTKYTPEKHYAALIEIFQDAVSGRQFN